jgi:hypothetical protein
VAGPGLDRAGNPLARLPFREDLFDRSARPPGTGRARPVTMSAGATTLPASTPPLAALARHVNDHISDAGRQRLSQLILAAGRLDRRTVLAQADVGRW